MLLRGCCSWWQGRLDALRCEVMGPLTVFESMPMLIGRLLLAPLVLFASASALASRSDFISAGEKGGEV